MLAIVTIAAWLFFDSWGSYRSIIIQELTSAQPTVLVEGGKIKQEVLAKERMLTGELFAEMRLMEIEDIKEVKTAALEPNGQGSVLKEVWAKTGQKQDVFEDKVKAAEKASNSQCHPVTHAYSRH